MAHSTIFADEPNFADEPFAWCGYEGCQDFSYHSHTQKNTDHIIQKLREASDKGSPNANYVLGCLLYTGCLPSIEQEMGEGVRRLILAAKRGVREAVDFCRTDARLMCPGIIPHYNGEQLTIADIDLKASTVISLTVLYDKAERPLHELRLAFQTSKSATVKELYKKMRNQCCYFSLTGKHFFLWDLEGNNWSGEIYDSECTWENIDLNPQRNKIQDNQWNNSLPWFE